MNLIYSGLTAQNVSDLVLGFSGVISAVFLAVMLLFGIYGLRGVLQLKKEQYLIPHRLMYPNYCSPDKCLEPVEYMDFILPRLSILSVVMLLTGVLLLLSYFIPGLRSLGMLLILYIVPFVVYLWYNGGLKRAAKKYW